jgi:hypothetical protein
MMMILESRLVRGLGPLLALVIVGLGCKDVDQYKPPQVERNDGSADGRGGAGGSGGAGSGTGGNIGSTGPTVPDSNEPYPTVDAPVTADVPADTGPPDPTCTANLPCTEGIGPCRQGATSCASPTSAPVCADVGADDKRGGCTGTNVCLGGACVAACATSVPCTDGIKPCRKGATTCATPTSPAGCADVGADDSKGGCAGGNVCSNGICVAPCAPNVPCTQGLGPCRKGVTSCASPSAQAVCTDAGADDSRGGCTGGNMCKGGTCVAPPPVTCDGQPVGAGRCSGTVHQTCGSNGQWAPDNSTQCKRADGGQCSTGSDCTSGNCSAGICCDSPCTGKCTSCSGADTGRANGNCSPVRAGSDPRNQCADSNESTCGTDGACDGAGECRLHGTSVVCAAARCSNGSSTAARRCNGQGACSPASPTSCGPYPCLSNGTCANDCATGFVLQGNACVACGKDGQPCCKGDRCGEFVHCRAYNGDPKRCYSCGDAANNCCEEKGCRRGQDLFCISVGTTTCWPCSEDPDRCAAAGGPQ